MFETRLDFEPVSVIQANLGIEPNGRVHKFFTNTCKLHMDKYVPFDTGTLATTVESTTDEIIYDQEYAKIVYYGVRDGVELNYQTDKHPLACSYWDERMWSAESSNVIEEVQQYYNTHF